MPSYTVNLSPTLDDLIRLTGRHRLCLDWSLLPTQVLFFASLLTALVMRLTYHGPWRRCAYSALQVFPSWRASEFVTYSWALDSLWFVDSAGNVAMNRDGGSETVSEHLRRTPSSASAFARHLRFSTTSV